MTLAGSIRVSVEPFEETLDRGGKGRDVVCCSRSNDRVRSIEIAMCELVSHARNLRPRNGRFALQQFRIDVFHRFADLDESHANGVEHDVVVDASSLEVVGDCSARHLDVNQPFSYGTAHSGIASASTRSATSGLRLFAGTMSTLQPKMRSASLRILPSANRPMSGAMSTSRSMSLCGPSSPRATLPKSRTWVAPKAWRLRSNRLRLPSTDWLLEDVGGDGTRATSSSKPAAETSLRRVSRLGSLLADSYALTTLWAMCALSASCT